MTLLGDLHIKAPTWGRALSLYGEVLADTHHGADWRVVLLEDCRYLCVKCHKIVECRSGQVLRSACPKCNASGEHKCWLDSKGYRTRDPDTETFVDRPHLCGGVYSCRDWSVDFERWVMGTAGLLAVQMLRLKLLHDMTEREIATETSRSYDSVHYALRQLRAKYAYSESPCVAETLENRATP